MNDGVVVESCVVLLVSCTSFLSCTVLLFCVNDHVIHLIALIMWMYQLLRGAPVALHVELVIACQIPVSFASMDSIGSVLLWQMVLLVCGLCFNIPCFFLTSFGRGSL